MSDFYSTGVPNDGEIRWLPVEVVGWDEIDDYGDKIMVTENSGHIWHAVISGELDHIPDAGNLAAVARVLAEHPGMGAAVKLAAIALNGHGQGKDSTAAELLESLAAALNGGAS